MQYLKYIIPVLILFSVMSCGKTGGVKPVTPIDTDLVIHEIKFSAPYQYASTKVVGDTLKVIYYENVNLYIPSNGFNLSYALHLKEDFSSSVLVSYNFTTVDAYGDVTYDWVDDNLNNVTAKTVKDTVINGASVTHITVQRPFTFFKSFNSTQIATNEQDSLLSLKSNKIVFTSYVYFGKTYPATSDTTNVYYIKAN